MTQQFDIRTLGDCKFDTPVESTVSVEEADRVLVDASTTACNDCEGKPDSLEKAGPRQKIFFDPATSAVGIVTCGGLCPGLNDVIRGITMVSWYRYGVRRILGLRYGYAGLVAAGAQEPLALTPRTVENIHQDGGTILGTSRGPQDVSAMVDFLVERGINILFTIGGDGTQRGSLDIANEVEKRGLPIAVVGIPKTIDNDISFTERTFGFETAVAASQTSITGAHEEARGARNGVGLVKLMGRESGFVAVNASLASSDVNMVLIPEIPFSLDKVMHYLVEERLKLKSHAVIVVAEGAGQDLVADKGTDKSGNKKLGDIGAFLKKAITEHCSSIGLPVSVKYIDPSYIIRSAPATANDSLFCFQLAENAVHAAMSGRTEMVVCLWNGKHVHVPTGLVVKERKKVDTAGLLWQSVLDNTGQPHQFT
jgi:6-phosphofructokinase 1